MAAAKVQFVSKPECAAALKISERTLTNYSKERWFPPAARKGRLFWSPELIRAAIGLRDRGAEGSAAPSSDKMDPWEELKFELLKGRARGQTAKSLILIAKAGEELKLLLPRISFEVALAELFSGVRAICEELPDRVHQIEGLNGAQQSAVKEFITAVLTPWQDGLANRIERRLKDLGEVPELLDLAEMSGSAAAATEDSDG
jgi:hypothetical protein